jgi:hypothetical protein
VLYVDLSFSTLRCDLRAASPKAAIPIEAQKTKSQKTKPLILLACNN